MLSKNMSSFIGIINLLFTWGKEFLSKSIHILESVILKCCKSKTHIHQNTQTPVILINISQLHSFEYQSAMQFEKNEICYLLKLLS